jgi:flagellin
MHISTLKGSDHRENTRGHRAAGGREDPAEVQAMLHSAIANLQVSSQNVSASDSRRTDAEMTPAMVAFTENQMVMQAGTATAATTSADRQTILELLQ